MLKPLQVEKYKCVTATTEFVPDLLTLHLGVVPDNAPTVEPKPDFNFMILGQGYDLESLILQDQLRQELGLPKVQKPAETTEVKVVAGDSTTDKRLANTGSDTASVGAVAALLGMLGVAGVAKRRRHQTK